MKLDHIFTDRRGSIHAVTGEPLNVPEVSFLETKAGLMRGGCIHSENCEHLTVIEGEIIYYWRGHSNRDWQVWNNEYGCFGLTLKRGESITIDRNVPHFMLSVTDSVIIEWGCTEEEKKAKHEYFREIVLKHNEGK